MSWLPNKNSHSRRNSCICNIVAGVVTLVMACVFAAGWVRGFYFGDTIEWDSIGFGSANGGIEIAFTEPLEMVWKWPVWNVEKVADADIDAEPADAFNWRFMDFGYTDIEFSGLRIRGIAIPYWAIVIPPTLLSAWLLLSKPRAKTTPEKQPPAI